MKYLKLIPIILKNLFLIIYDEIRDYVRRSSRKKLGVTVLVIILLIGGGVFWYKKTHPKEDNRSIYEALVQMTDQHSGNPDEDKRASLKKGDVIAIFPEGHPWTETEKISNLIVKLKITQEEADELTEPVLGTPSQSPSSEGEEGSAPTQDVVQARKYTLRISVPSVNDLVKKGQPYKDKVFDDGVIKTR